MAAKLVRYTVSDAIAQITLDRAPVNALSMPLIDALLDGLEKARNDAAVRAVIVCSAHKVFCAGLDLDIVRGKRGTETKLFLERLYFALNDLQYRMGKPTIAAIVNRVSHGAGQRSGAQGNRARAGANHRAAFRGKVAYRHENRPRCLYAGSRCGLSPRDRKCGRELCAGGDDTGLPGRA